MLGLGRHTKKQQMPLFQQNYFQTRLKLHGLIAMSKISILNAISKQSFAKTK